MTVNDVLNRTDWEELAQQKAELVEAIEDFKVKGPEEWSRSYYGRVEKLLGVLHWIDALQDAAEGEGFPVVFLTEEEG